MDAPSLSKKFGGVVLGQEEMVDGRCNSVLLLVQTPAQVRGSTDSMRRNSANFLYSMLRSAILSFSLISLKSLVRPSETLVSQTASFRTVQPHVLLSTISLLNLSIYTSSSFALCLAIS